MISENTQKYYKYKKINFNIKQLEAVLGMHAEGATIPFMARYRKEKTQNLDEVQIQQIIDAFESFEVLNKRKAFVLEEIEKQKQLTPELKLQIEQSLELSEIEELYRPYKRKKKTKAKMAKDAGLQPLADWIWSIGQGEAESTTSGQVSLEVKAKSYINPTAGFATYEEALRGAQHINIEKILANLELRKEIREDFFKNAVIKTSKGKKYKTNSKFKMYEEFSEPVKSLKTAKNTHRYMAIRRGLQESELKVDIEANNEDQIKLLENFACPKSGHLAEAHLKSAAKIAFTIHMLPSISNEIHAELKAIAEEQAIEVFAENVRQVLMGSPFGSHVVLGVDPGLKTGCKLALVGKEGQFITNTVLKILGDKAHDMAVKLFTDVFKQLKIDAIAVGNGTGGREAEVFIRKVLKEIGKEVPVVMVNESGASIYSASEVARNEFPDLDLTVRGAVSIARRLQDPLSELVKIDPKSIGVGQYQHDVTQSQLQKALTRVVESCVNQVGVNLNTASTSLLKYVSGVGPAIAANIVEHREKNGLFKNRDELMKVPKLGSKAYELAAGFLRVSGGDTVLDNTGIHPERYAAVKDMASELKLKTSDLMLEGSAKVIPLKEKWSELVGEFTFNDIVSELGKPGRDPRDPYKVFQYRDDIHQVSDLEEGMICPGLVSNVTNFGAFVDIGVHQDGLVHLSQMSHTFISDPKQFIKPGAQVKVKVIKVDKEQKQIALSMLLTEKPTVKKVPASKGASGKKKFSGKRPPNKNFKGKPGQRGNSNRGPRKPSQPFNNPFAALADLKK